MTARPFNNGELTFGRFQSKLEALVSTPGLVIALLIA